MTVYCHAREEKRRGEERTRAERGVAEVQKEKEEKVLEVRKDMVVGG